MPATAAVAGALRCRHSSAARGKEGLNEQGYDPYDPSAIDSSNLDTKPVFIALALATVAIGALSVSNTAPPPPMT